MKIKEYEMMVADECDIYPIMIPVYMKTNVNTTIKEAIEKIREKARYMNWTDEQGWITRNISVALQDVLDILEGL